MTPGAGITEQETDARTRLREAALEQFGRRGLNATSTRDIIKAAGLRNPSAINYYFGSKARLVDDLIREVNRDQSAIIQQQVALVRDAVAPAPEPWPEIAVDAACGLLATERGCLLIRLWADRDDEQPEAVEEFLGGHHPLAVAWRDAVATTFPELRHEVAIARCVVQLRTLQFLTVRRARGLLSGAAPAPTTDAMASRAFLLELSRNILGGPTAISSG
jgi:AcrR family transcriptional regulator